LFGPVDDIKEGGFTFPVPGYQCDFLKLVDGKGDIFKQDLFTEVACQIFDLEKSRHIRNYDIQS
jgi:hypothetical protein